MPIITFNNISPEIKEPLILINIILINILLRG